MGGDIKMVNFLKWNDVCIPVKNIEYVIITWSGFSDHQFEEKFCQKNLEFLVVN